MSGDETAAAAGGWCRGRGSTDEEEEKTKAKEEVFEEKRSTSGLYPDLSLLNTDG